ncbi:beta-1,3-galactosyltransferase pvg3-like [Zingiber officinale]|uniref:Hexosyltransferase n=1 Tax=Zingiber officinale TaxID=94328 RepID=A0A8J5GX77_ZINOF|nr:beta-1,3-galactosyltransferase pvg3-like [Zingiber officinale]XP_042384008.1 beta-1,3-galactosyltransferase pvg3-like [Zingiber officinale]XP_042384009.1 beta-1,3-galactosyltransferase pvg3-like [Zingiber officinale]XP_042384010.1 beta-1,3-galactosyltransferase pvg3-like [Zingiber officinale]KAG6511746.1 hypothetical protein ZIOFF_029823 [Zingiber officinale]
MKFDMMKLSPGSSCSILSFSLLPVSLISFLFFVIYPNEFRLQSLLTSSSHCTNSSSVAALVESVTPKSDFRLLMGILSLPDNYERRHLLRDVYALQFRDFPGATIDVRFVFCNLTKDEERILVGVEILLHRDIIILNCQENMDRGKTYTYFSTVAKLFSHAPYDYVMKVDDDAYFRLGKLAELLREMPRAEVYYGLNNWCSTRHKVPEYMLGMGYGLSWDLVEWVATSDIPRKHAVGPEDFQTGVWIKEGKNGTRTFYNMEPRMHDFNEEESSTCYRHDMIPDSMTVHKLKSRQRWAATLSYFNVTAGVYPSKLYHLN